MISDLGAIPGIATNGAAVPNFDDATAYEHRRPGREDDETPAMFRRYTMAELLDAPRTFEWVARGMFVRPTYCMTAGELKTLKTYVSLVTAVSVAAGVDVLDHFQVDQAAPVVIYVGEGGRIPYTRRIERIAQAVGIDAAGLRDLPIYPMFETAGIKSTRFQATLNRDLDEIEPGLVILDPLYSFHGSKSDARNLHEEGELLNSISGPVTEAGAVLDIVNHYNQGGSGENLKRITMAGGGEWVDTWRLLSHRETPDVPAGKFKLRLAIGSRQWGGADYDLDFNVGRFNVNTGEYDGPITFELHRSTGGALAAGDGDERRVLDLVTAHPFELTKEEVATGAGGNVQRMRDVVRRLEERGAIKPALTARLRVDGRPRNVWAYGPASDPRTAQTAEGTTTT